MTDNATDVAIIGMAARLPGAGDYGQYWRNLAAGVESITEFTEAESLADGADPELLADPWYVPRAGVIERPEWFDCEFFGVEPADAAVIDPQQRLLLECAWQALEDAGQVPDRFPGPVGVFAGTTRSTYFMWLMAHRAELDLPNAYQLLINHDKDFAPTRISHRLNLTGPSLNVQTACSTSLVAVHLAVQSLLNRECDMALVGAVSVLFPQRVGYVHDPTATGPQGGIVSADGRCRPFDADGTGTVPGNGVAVVVLRRREDAEADGDAIRALIKGTAINNDGGRKLGFTTPAFAGQTAVISEALAVSGVDADTVTYVEAHGTGTPLGDPIEVAALTEAFRAFTDRTGYCGLGSAKGNIGYLGVAGGLAGLIKTVLAMEHGELPATLHLRRPNPNIDFGASPFRVVTEQVPWPGADVPGVDPPRRAGVSSFGVGGTNAHVILEEAPSVPAAAPVGGPRLIPLSARSPRALARMAELLAGHLREHPDLDVANVAYTLQTGRARFSHRRFVVAGDLAEAAAALDVHATATPAGVHAAGDDRAALDEVGRLWLDGAEPDWSRLDGSARRKVPLPTYPFERRRLRLDLPGKALEDPDG